uniref:ATP-dependent Clp protease proteolytic subunit n=1 Tax=Populus trichocarpa TaxID=3694 RepID=B9N4I4_POPTR
METEGFAIHDSMMQLKNEKHTVAVGAAGAAGGQACLLLAAGTKGKRHMMPHAKAVIQQPRVPSSGLMPASDVLIRAKEILWQGQEKIMADVMPPEDWDKSAGIKVVEPF